MKKVGYAGTYTEKESKGIYSFEFEDGILSNAKLFAEIRNPKYLCVDQDRIYALADHQGSSGIVVLDKEGKEISSLYYENKTSCFITVKDHMIYTVNYHEGTVSQLCMNSDQLQLTNQTCIRNNAGSHQIMFWKDLMLVPCLLLDRLMILNMQGTVVSELVFPDGTGPRHGVITHDQKTLYLVSELSNELFTIDLASMKIKRQISILADGLTHVKDTAAIRMSSDEHYLYISTRTQDIISTVKIRPQTELIQTISSGGQHPRDILLSEPYLLVGNRFTNNLVSMNLKNGIPAEIQSSITIPEIVSIAMEDK